MKQYSNQNLCKWLGCFGLFFLVCCARETGIEPPLKENTSYEMDIPKEKYAYESTFNDQQNSVSEESRNDISSNTEGFLGPDEHLGVDASMEFYEFQNDGDLHTETSQATADLSSTDLISEEAPEKICSNPPSPPVTVFQPNLVNFGTIQVGCIAKQEVSYFNRGSLDVQITGVSLSSSSAPSFQLLGVRKLPHLLKSGESLSITISYQPTGLQVDKGVLLLAAVTSGSNVSDAVVMEGEGTTAQTRNEFFRQTKRPKVDVLFVIDTTVGGMADYQAYLRSQILRFLDWGTKLQADYQIGLISAGTHSPYSPGCLMGQPRYITPETPNPLQALQKNIPISLAGVYPTSGLENIYRAFTCPHREGLQCNFGFLRPDAMLSIIVLSLFYDQSEIPGAFYQSFLRGLKGRHYRDMIRFSAWVGPPPQGCSDQEYATIAYSSERYWDMAKFFRGIQASICDRKTDVLDQMGAVTFRYRESFTLEQPAVEDSITVAINGVPLPTGWNFKKQDNEIVFAKNHVPPPDSTIGITYKTQCFP